MTQPPLAIVRAWQEKSAEASIRSRDRLFSVVSKGFDAMAALLAKDSDPVDVQIVLGYFNVDRTIALQVDKVKDESLRDIVYGLLESLHVSLNEWNEERNQKMNTGEISTQTEEYTISFLRPIIPSYEASLPTDNQTSNNLSTISASELMRDEKIIMKEELDNQYSDPISPDSMDAPDFTRTLLPFNPREELRNEAVTGNNQMSSLLVPLPSIIPPQEAVPIDFVHPSENLSTMGNFTPFNPKIKKEEPMETQEVHNDNEIGSRDFMEEEQNDNVIRVDGRDSVANDLIDYEGEQEDEEEVSIGEPADTPKDTSDSDKVEKRKRSSRLPSRPMQYAESTDDSDDDGGPSMKKSRSDSTRKADNKRTSTKGEDKSESASKKLNVSKENATYLECPECEFRTRIVATWILHLRNKHSTTPSLAGLALFCKCGHESLSDEHSRKCNRSNTTVIRKRDGPIGRLHVEKVTLQSFLCEAYPKTAYGYAKHLDTHHKSTLSQNGIYLICSCGVEVRSRYSPKHVNECNPRQFTLHKRDDD